MEDHTPRGLSKVSQGAANTSTRPSPWLLPSWIPLSSADMGWLPPGLVLAGQLPGRRWLPLVMKPDNTQEVTNGLAQLVLPNHTGPPVRPTCLMLAASHRLSDITDKTTVVGQSRCMEQIYCRDYHGMSWPQMSGYEKFARVT